ncbi:RNA-directed DNA polymerase, eukaryota [Tanacetum coccineum]
MEFFDHSHTVGRAFIHHGRQRHDARATRAAGEGDIDLKGVEARSHGLTGLMKRKDGEFPKDFREVVDEAVRSAGLQQTLISWYMLITRMGHPLVESPYHLLSLHEFFDHSHTVGRAFIHHGRQRHGARATRAAGEGDIDLKGVEARSHGLTGLMKRKDGELPKDFREVVDEAVRSAGLQQTLISWYMLITRMGHPLVESPYHLLSLHKFGVLDFLLETSHFGTQLEQSWDNLDLSGIEKHRGKDPDTRDPEWGIKKEPKEARPVRKTPLCNNQHSLSFPTGTHYKRQKQCCGASLMSHKFEITTIVLQVSSKDLWKLCDRQGVVADVYIARKLSKSGRRFGFVRFIKNPDQANLLEDLNKIWIGSHHLFAM